jgi:type IV pilus assembly protein PilW
MNRPVRRAVRGLSLVELMVAVAISLVLVLAATAAYLGTRDTQRTIDGANAAHESGVFALRLIGRELMNAGFWPAVRFADPARANVRAEYENITGFAAYDSGLFGCDGGVFDLATRTCPAPVAGAPDSLVVGYFTSDAMGAGVGQRTDCEGVDVGTAGATFNVGRQGAGPAGQPPALPLFIANHYTLVGGAAGRAGVQEAVTVDGRTVNTFSLGCNGNGDGGTGWSAIVSGLEDLQITYGVFTDDTRTPARFHTATEVNALGTLTIDGVPMPAWTRVAAVRVCVIARTFESPVALATAAGTSRTFEDCNGVATAQPAGDRSLRKTYVQVFGVRNRQTTTY